MKPSPPPDKTIQTNVESVLRLEQENDRRMSVVDRVSESVGNFVGSIGFVAAQLALVAVWIGLNLELIPQVKVFDPYPYPLLWGVLSLEAVVLTAFVLIRQNRMARNA